MPPKKRGRGASPSNAEPTGNKKARFGSATVIGEDAGETALPSRPKRESVVEHNYSDTRRNAATTGASKAKTITKPNDGKKRESASATGANVSQKRGRGRPPQTANPELGESGPVEIVRGRGRPKKIAADASAPAKPAASLSKVKKPVGRPKGKKGQAAKNAVSNMTDVDMDESETDASESGRQYWLMKAEPESRIEKGQDVKFSIDDLAAAKGPVAWDGVRNYQARNNMRAMRLGDLVFLYHSSCKVPGIAGVMNVVGEHSLDVTAFDPESPYYDAKSTVDKPKWDIVHVTFNARFTELIPLTDLRQFGKPGGALEGMPLLKYSRLSVSPVARAQWIWIMAELAQLDESAEVKEAKLVEPTQTKPKPKPKPKTKAVPKLKPKTKAVPKVKRSAAESKPPPRSESAKENGLKGDEIVKKAGIGKVEDVGANQAEEKDEAGGEESEGEEDSGGEDEEDESKVENEPSEDGEGSDDETGPAANESGAAADDTEPADDTGAADDDIEVADDTEAANDTGAADDSGTMDNVEYDDDQLLSSEAIMLLASVAAATPIPGSASLLEDAPVSALEAAPDLALSAVPAALARQRYAVPQVGFGFGGC